MNIKLLFVSFLLAGCHSAHGESAVSPTSDNEHEVAGFAQPESALHDSAADVYLVSNVAGSPFEKDGNGYISRVSPDGTLESLHWIDGLDAPKGMAIHGDTLAIADLTVLRRFDRRTGAPRDVITIEGAVFLNDVASASDGSFFVSDSGFLPKGEGIEPTAAAAIYRIASDGSVTRIASGIELASPNGLALHGDEVLMAPFGAAKLLRFAADGTRLGEEPLPHGLLDGLVVLRDGCVLVSSLEGEVLHGRLGGSFKPLLSVMAMDIGLDARRGRLLLPLMMDNKLQILPLTGACTGSSGGAQRMSSGA